MFFLFVSTDDACRPTVDPPAASEFGLLEGIGFGDVLILFTSNGIVEIQVFPMQKILAYPLKSAQTSPRAIILSQ